jgi:hypothetical protein
MVMLRTLVKTGTLNVDGQSFDVHYFEVRTLRGLRRYSAEILLAPGDRIILDDDSVDNLETRAARLVPATVYCRSLTTANTACVTTESALRLGAEQRCSRVGRDTSGGVDLGGMRGDTMSTCGEVRRP